MRHAKCSRLRPGNARPFVLMVRGIAAWPLCQLGQAVSATASVRYETLFDKVHSFVLFAPDHQQYVPGLAYCRFHRRGPDTPKLVYTTPPVDLDGDGLDDLVQVQKTLEGYRLIINTGNGVSHVLRDFIPSTEPPPSLPYENGHRWPMIRPIVPIPMIRPVPILPVPKMPANRLSYRAASSKVLSSAKPTGFTPMTARVSGAPLSPRLRGPGRSPSIRHGQKSLLPTPCRLCHWPDHVRL